MTVATPSPTSWPACLPRFGTPRRPDRPSHGARLAAFAAQLGTPLMPWQQHVADVALEVDPATGRLAHRRVVLTVPRQSGKTTFLLALFAWRALAMGSPQSMAFTAQNGLDARMRLRREWFDTLRRSVLAETFVPSWATGAEALLFHNGSRLQVVAGTEKSGHGLTLDLAVVDEAFAQPDGRLEQALSPTMLTRPEPQLWYVSTAGSPADAWFREKVEQGRTLGDEPESGVAFFEWSAPDDADPRDRAVWRSCMPALGHTVSEATIAAECLGMPEDEFRRAYLNQWVVRHTETAFDPDRWSALGDPDAERGESVVFGLATAPDRSWCAITAAWTRPDGAAQVSLIDYRQGTAWVPERAAELVARWSGRFVADQASRGLVEGALEPSTAAAAQAHNGFADAILAGTVRHGNEPALNVAVRASRWRPSGETRVLDRKGSADISPVIAAALAVYGLSQRGPSVYEGRGLVAL